MDLSKPAYDAVLNWDKKLEQLQNEVKQLEKEYGFSEEHIDFYNKKKQQQQQQEKTAPKPKTATQQKTKTSTNLKKNRYEGLPEVKVDEKAIPKPMPKPEIDPSWQSAHKMKASLETFYDKSVFMPKYVDNKDFECKPVFCSDYNYFYNYMGSFALNYTK